MGIAPLVAAVALGAVPAPARAPLEAYFAKRSAAPRHAVVLRIHGRARTVELRLFRAGGVGHHLAGEPVTEARTVRRRSRQWTAVHVRLGDWPSGLYFARVRSPGGHLAFAPIVVRADARHRSRVAVVLPTNTWQAYNFRDDNGDDVADSWYASPGVHTVELARPFAAGGIPPHFRAYDVQFLRWLVRSGRPADFLADDDLESVPTARILKRRYDLVVFPGHEEYATPHAYDLVSGYVARGGNLMLLSANNFFYRVLRAGTRITRAGRWRDLGRPEAAWIGSQYVDWNHNRYPNAPYTVVGARAAPWLFAGTRLRNGDAFGSYGVEIDATTPFSPPGTHVLARIPNVFGVGESAEMTYRESRAGARVFAAGAIDFGGSALNPVVSPMLENLWKRMGGHRNSVGTR